MSAATFWERLRSFKPAEFDNGVPGNGIKHMQASFMFKLDTLRAILNRPMSPSSGHRTPEHNQAVSNTGPNGPHTTGRAADFPCHGATTHAMLHAVCLTAVVEAGYLTEAQAKSCLKDIVAKNLGFTGIGLNQKGDARFIHLDDLQAPNFPRPGVWTY